MNENGTRNGSGAHNGTPAEQQSLVINGKEHTDFEFVEPGSKAHATLLPEVYDSHQKFSSRSSHHGIFSSVKSIASRASVNLAHAKPTLQSSWVNVSVPVPLGASKLALDKVDTGQSQEQLALEKTAPPDRYRLVYIILLIHGIGVLMPWNMFLTANSYFTDFKLAPRGNGTETEYAKNFLAYLGITAQLPNLILNAVNIFCQCGSGSPKLRVTGSIFITIIMFIFTVILAMVNSDEWQGIFFGLTMLTVVIINMCCGVYQNTVYGIAGRLPMKYTNAVIFGNNISGVLTSLIMIITIVASPDTQWAAIWYFITAVIILCVALDSYFALPFLKFYRHYFPKLEKTPVSTEEGDNTQVIVSSEQINNERPPYLQLFKKIWLQLLGVWLTFFVTLVCFPAIQADVKPSDPNFFIPDHLYTPIITFLIFNLFAALGNLTTEWIRKPGPRFVIIPIVLRVLFIPFFMLCNFRPDVRTTIPVLIDNDWVFIIGCVVMAYTSGYFSSLCMMYAPSLVEPKWAGTAAMIAAFFLILGIICGVNFTLVCAKIVEI